MDIRGVATRNATDILAGRDWEQSVNSLTDTTVYSLDKIVKLLLSCNPNTIEMLGLRPEHYLVLSPAGHMLVENRHLFLSKRAINSFGGYARAQLNRLCNKSGRALNEMANNEERSINNAIGALIRDGVLDRGVFVETVDDSMVMRLNQQIPFEGFVKLSQAVLAVHTDYCRSTRNDKACEHNKLAKHMMHLIRLYHMAFDILDRGEIITYRDEDHDFLMDIRGGKYLEDGVSPTEEFMQIVKEYESRLQRLAETTKLPDHPDEKRVRSLLVEINGAIVDRARNVDD